MEYACITHVSHRIYNLMLVDNIMPENGQAAPHASYIRGIKRKTAHKYTTLRDMAK